VEIQASPCLTFRAGASRPSARNIEGEVPQVGKS
jgi:hypothetical protein